MAGAVYRLLPALGDFRTLFLGPSLVTLIRWQIQGSPSDARPTELDAELQGDPKLRVTEFPSGYPGAPILSGRVAELVREEFAPAGSFVPVHVEGAAPGAYVLFLVESIVDCLDTRRSSKPKKTTGEVKKAIFRPEAVPSHLPAFRLPEYPGGVYWTSWATTRLTTLIGPDVETRLVWSEDPTATPHPNPWGF
ncbi:hypothetical protein ACFVT5_35605 [Streptomyces sp. NPDC058001]|uniref:hypothetical protein n=1 Tax=Streptomyces sp. NPDC058001 TaxID=3346300 RepID=UPI0036E4818A